MDELEELRGKHVVFLSWRDTHNPEGGGAERYLETVAAGLVGAGASVTIFCAAYPGAAPDEVVDGIRYVRRGTKLSVYAQGIRALHRGDLGRADVVVDVQNGLPFFTRPFSDGGSSAAWRHGCIAGSSTSPYPEPRARSSGVWESGVPGLQWCTTGPTGTGLSDPARHPIR
jgi:hypothetical protein